MNKIVAVTSGKGGTGKSTFCANLARAALKNFDSVLLIDMDAGMRCLDMLLSVSDSVLMDVSDVVKGADLESSMLEIPKCPGLFLLPAPAKTGLVEPEAFGDFINKVSERFSLVIIDFPAGSDFTLYEKLPYKTDFVCICNPDPISVRDASSVGQMLRAIKRTGYLVINKYNYRYINNLLFSNLDDILNQTGLQLLGIVPFSELFIYSFSTGKFPRRGREAKAFKRIVGRIADKNIPLPKLKKI